MTERMLTCPRCGTKSPVSTGQCANCGLKMLTKRRREVLGPDAPPARFLQGRARKVRAQRAKPTRATRSPSATGETERHFGGGDLAPARRPKEGMAPVAASGKTSLYSLDGIRPMSGLETFTGEEIGADEIRRDANGQPIEPPKGGDVEVGSMKQWLMDPSDNPNDLQETTASLNEKSAAGGLDLGLAPRQFGKEGKPPKPPIKVAKPKAAKMPAGDLSLKEHSPAPPESEPKPFPMPPSGDDEEVVISKMKTKKGGPKKKIETGKFLLKWLTPQVILFLFVLLGGPKYIYNNYVLEGFYRATFSDTEGRRVECTTRFRPDGSKLTGMFECKLYPSKYSLQRIDEPKVLKVIMGSGNVVYSGHYSRNSISLTLGSMNESETRSVSLSGKFSPNIERMTGVLTNPLNQFGRFELVKAEIIEE